MVTDWFHPQWLAVGILILLLCGADALLTLTLISRGAVEVNPVMDPLVRGSGQSFALWKFVLGTLIALLPGILAWTVFGEQITTALEDSSKVSYWMIGAALVLLGAFIYLSRRWLRSKGW